MKHLSFIAGEVLKEIAAKPQQECSPPNLTAQGQLLPDSNIELVNLEENPLDITGFIHEFIHDNMGM